MSLDFTPFFQRYGEIIREADQVFAAVRDKFSENVRCEKGCSDCCHALFDLTLVEALYLNHHFNAQFSGRAKNDVLERADDADRIVHRIKREAFKAVKDGKNAQDILAEMATVRVRCPLLNDDGACAMYEHRPVTCRIYGVPTAIGGSAHTCGKSGFEQGKPYPTVYLDRIQDKLYALSHELAATLNSRYKELGEVLVPASLALLTDYNEEYLGVGGGKPASQPAPADPAARMQEVAAKAARKPLSQKLAEGKAAKGKGLPECSGCADAAKKGGCSGCSPKTFTIGQAPEKPAKKPAAKKPAKKA
jgi:Fe-S-cluster containining protein